MLSYDFLCFPVLSYAFLCLPMNSYAFLCLHITWLAISCYEPLLLNSMVLQFFAHPLATAMARQGKFFLVLGRRPLSDCAPSCRALVLRTPAHPPAAHPPQRPVGEGGGSGRVEAWRPTVPALMVDYER